MRSRLENVAGAGATREESDGTLRVMPDSTDAAAAVLALCSGEGWRVWPAGSGSRRTSAGRGRAVVVSTERMAGLTVYRPEDLTLGCRAGTRHGQLGEATATNRQLLPLDPAAGDSATIGGTLALGDAGPLRAGYGAPRDLALGITVVAGDGRVLRFGGQVVKNVAGYDLVRLLAGSRGTLGLITEMHLRLRAAPERDLTVLLAAPGPHDAAQLAIAVRDATAPVALEILAPATPAEDWQVGVRLHGSAIAVADARARIAALVAAPLELDAVEANAWWAALATRERRATLRLTVLPGQVGALLEAVTRGPAAAFCCAHATEGIIRVGFQEAADPEALSGFQHEVVSLGGTWSYISKSNREAGHPDPRARLPEPPPRPERVVRLERELRAQFDPAGILPDWES